MVEVAVKLGPFLLTVQGHTRGIHIQDQPPRGFLKRGDELLNQHPVEGARRSARLTRASIRESVSELVNSCTLPTAVCIKGSCRSKGLLRLRQPLLWWNVRARTSCAYASR